MKKILLTVVLAMACTLPAMAEDLNYNVVAFSERASVRVPNDTMSVVLRIMENGRSRQEVSNTVSRRVNAVLERAKKNAVLEVETGNRQTYPEYDDKRKIKGWTDSAELRVQSQDFDALSKLVADSQDDAMIDHVFFSVSPKTRAAAVETASQQALRAFQVRAKHISNSLGFANYKIVNIQLDQSFNNHGAEGVTMVAASMNGLMKSARYQAADVMQTSPGMQEIQQTVRGSIQMQ